MKKSNAIGIVSGCVSGFLGSILVSEFQFSLLFVGFVGIFVGLTTSYIFSFFK